MTAEVVPFPHPGTSPPTAATPPTTPTTTPTAPSARTDGPSTVAALERTLDGDRADLVGIATALREASPRILDNWAIRVSTMPLFRAIPDLTLADLRQRMPDVLEAALLAVTSSSLAVDLLPLDDAIARGQEHGRSRCEVASLDVVLAEFHALRREVRAQLWRVADGLVADAGRRERLSRDLDDRLSAVLDEIEQAAAVAWVEGCGSADAVRVMAS